MKIIDLGPLITKGDGYYYRYGGTGDNRYSENPILSLDPDANEPTQAQLPPIVLPSAYNLISSPLVRRELPQRQDVWVFKRKCFRVKDADGVPPAEIALRIKHAVYRAEKALGRIQKEVAAFENFDRLPSARRERIPESVRLFVWQRDGGQ